MLISLGAHRRRPQAGVACVTACVPRRACRAATKARSDRLSDTHAHKHTHMGRHSPPPQARRPALVVVLLHALLLACAAATRTVCADAAAHAFTNTEVVRSIDATSHIVNIVSEVTAQAARDGVDTYAVAFAEDVARHVAWVGAQDTDGNVLEVGTGAPQEGGDGFVTFPVSLGRRLNKGDAVELAIAAVTTHSLRPYPAEISQLDPQLVVLAGNVYFSSPYATVTQTTTVALGSTKVLDHTELEPTKARGETLVYGPYEDVAAQSMHPLRVHFENNSPFATVTRCEREVEVSLWGNVAVEEVYDLENDGAKLKGGFSRIDYQMRMATSASFRQLTGHLPVAATDVYYRDIIGNISTSAVRHEHDKTVLEVQARFPIFGGWKTQWYQGYNLPTKFGSVLTVNDDGTHTLEVDAGVPFPSVVVDELELHIVLPEGAEDVLISAPFDVERLPDQRRYTYLDSPASGRVVVGLRARNYVAQMQGKLRVTYRPTVSLLREPLMLVAGLFAVFASYSVLSRVDMRIE